MATDDSDAPKVKELLDPATEADLLRWFSLPSFQQLAERPKPKQVVDEEMQAVIARRDKALAAVDPAFVARLRARTEDQTASLIKFEAKIDVHVDDDFGLLDEVMIDRAYSIAEPREFEIADELRDDLTECTPQALLRDLHRAELYFDKSFEIVDVAADQRFDIVAEVATAMATSWKLPRLERSPVLESAELVAGARAQRRRPWTELLPALPNRRVAE
jgi:hypothetical protein